MPKQQLDLHQITASKLPTTISLPMIEKRTMLGRISTIQPESWRCFQQNEHPAIFQCPPITKSNNHPMPNVKLDPLPKTALKDYDAIENLLAPKTVSFYQNKNGKNGPFWKSFKQIHDADTSAESQSNKKSKQGTTKRHDDLETTKQYKFNSCRIINSKKIPFKIGNNLNQGRKARRSLSIQNVSRIEKERNEKLQSSFEEEIQGLLKHL